MVSLSLLKSSFISITPGMLRLGHRQLWQIADSDPVAYNERGRKPLVVIEEKQLQDIPTELVAPPLSIIIYRLSTK